MIADLGLFYGRIEELRWRLRVKLEAKADLVGMTVPLAEELVNEVKDLLERVDAELADPSVRPLGVTFNDRVVGGPSLFGNLGGANSLSVIPPE